MQLRSRRRRSVVSVLALVAPALSIAASCKSDGGGAPADGGGGICPMSEADGGAPFTFHVRNGSAQPHVLALGCGQNPPIAIQTAGATLGIGPGAADPCAFTCEPVLAGAHGPTGCSDCGAGISLTMAPGDVRDIVWDRRVWATSTIPARCSGLKSDVTCAFAIPPATGSTTTVTALLTYCPEIPATLSCVDPQTVTFLIDLTTDGADVTLP